MYACNAFQVAKGHSWPKVSLKTAAAVLSDSKHGYARCGCRNCCSNKKQFVLKFILNIILSIILHKTLETVTGKIINFYPRHSTAEAGLIL